MVQIAMLITGSVAGRKARDPQHAARIIGIVFAVTLAVQTALVASDDGLSTSSDIAIYTVVQVVSLAVAIGIALVLLARRGSAVRA